MKTFVDHHGPPRLVKSKLIKTSKFMIPKTSPEVSGAIRARLIDLRSRKAALDQAIASLERYATYRRPPGTAARRQSPKVVQMKRGARWAVAA